MFPNPESLVGQELAGYRIKAVVGRGGMGIVYRAESLSLGRMEALKIVDPLLMQDQRFLARLHSEARALARLHHPYIVTIHDLRKTEAGLCIVMEYVDGETLSDRLKAKGALPLEEALPIMKQLLSALGSAHQADILHRDIKPRNIMLTRQGDVRMMDFGLAKVAYEGREDTTTDAHAGTLYYMSPEQVKGLRHVDARSDLYSLGMTFYEMLSGRLPFDRQASKFIILKAIVEEAFPTPSVYREDLPPALVAFVMKTLEKEPENRYQSAQAMLADLDAIEKTIIVPAALPGTAAPRKARRHPALASVGVAMALVVLFVLAGYGWFSTTVDEGGASGLAAEVTAEPESTAEPHDALRQMPLGVEAAGPEDSEEADAATVPAPDGATASGAVPEVQEAQRAAAPAAAPASAPVVGRVRFTSEPSGARVLIDGISVGTTPYVADEVPAGTRTVELTLNGHRPHRTTIAVQPGRATQVAAELAPLMGTLEVSVRPWGNVYVDGKLIREEVDFRTALTLPVGSHQVRIENPSFGQWARTVTIPAETPHRIAVDFTRKVQVSVVAFDTENQPLYGQIWVDGKPTGRETPSTIEVPVGLHRVEVRLDGYRPEGAVPELMLERDLPEPLQLTLRKNDP